MTDSLDVPETAAAEEDGRRDFDFLIGTWRVGNRKLANPLDPGGEWLEFTSRSETSLVHAGLGNVERYVAPAMPGRGHYEGLAVRLFDPVSRTWRIWWASTVRPGFLEIPMVGRFVNGHGVFDCDDVIEGKAIKIRFDWTSTPPASARWQQAFSTDGGVSWVPNWVMDFTRDE
jgi:hypothetical protein